MKLNTRPRSTAERIAAQRTVETHRALDRIMRQRPACHAECVATRKAATS